MAMHSCAGIEAETCVRTEKLKRKKLLVQQNLVELLSSYYDLSCLGLADQHKVYKSQTLNLFVY